MSGAHLQESTGEARRSRPVGRKSRGGRKPVWQLVLMDLLMTGLILCVFAAFHHVIPRIRLQKSGPPAPIATADPSRLEKPTATLPSRPDAESEPEDRPQTEPEPTAEPTPDPGDWGALFSERFTESVVVTEDSYSSPNLSVTVSRVSTDDPLLTYYLADIYIADLSCFRVTMPAGRTYDGAENIARNSGAVIAINGDFAVIKKDGLCVRNGDIYSTGATSSDICVLYYDGVMETFSQDGFNEEALMERGVYQVWQFGPALLNGEGQPLAAFNTSSALLSRHPRTALGYYEPGHYCFLVADGRRAGYSNGLTMDELARLMAELGCVQAFNLDGGASSQIVFQGERINRPSDDRQLNDMLIIREPETGETGEEP